MSSSGLRALAFFGLLSLAPPLVLAQQVQGRPAQPRPQAPLPVPEFHGTYAVLEGKLLGLDVPAASTATPQLVEIKVGAFAGAAAILDRKPLVSYRTLKVPVLPKNLQFVCFYQTSGLISGMTAASQIKLRPVPFVRKVTANTGWPNQVLVSGPGRSWAADTLGGGLMSSVGAGTPDWLAPIGLLTKPMPGHPDMIIGVPERALEAGLYQLAIGDEPKELATRPPAYFA
ncbi:MAG: hypothetical protein NTY02_14735, partial [Acidobacteria bacterium]|nr:hypothetical protein [Acidobacteriota bacterium]